MKKPTLVIVESPAKANTIKKFLGRNYKVVASVGHVMDLPKNELGVDITNGFTPKYVIPKGKHKILSQIKRDAKAASEVLLALDLDREGEAIAWHLEQYLTKVQENIKRIIFNEITKSAIEEAVASPTTVDMNKVDAQQARRILDRLVGYLISPILWQIFYYGLSAGRVQTVGLRLIAEREEEVRAFRPEEYWTIDTVLLTKDGAEIAMKLALKNGEKISLKKQSEVEPILEELRGSRFIVDSVAKKEKKRNPQPPYITSTLQRDAAYRLRFSAKKIMMLAQQLYEGIDLGNKERVGLITYMRTDSVRISNHAQDSARAYIERAFGKEYLPAKPKTFRKRKESQDAHEAIRPTDVERNPDSVKKYLSRDQYALYELIWRRFVASQMESARYDTTDVSVRAGTYTLKASGRVLTFPGFLSVYDESFQENGGELPPLSEGDELTPKSIDGNQHFTEPPPRYTEATLIKELEERGIGRPSTYANIVSIIQDREYVLKQDGKLMPTTLGKQVWLTLEGFFPEVFDMSFTAEMEKELDKVEGGIDSWQDVVKDFYRPFKKSLDQIEGRKERIKSSLQEETDISCEKCGRKLIKKWGRNGQFLACPAYPECKYSRPLEEEVPSVRLDGTCPKCGGSLVLKVGRFGRFAACERYPKCKHTESYSIGMDCPSNGCGGRVVEKVTRRGKRFYGCSNYPKCSFASWDKPTANVCPHCQNPYLVEKTSKKRGMYYKCPECKKEVTLD
ncbi:MAG: type I DNA topoisomerase [Candidatus Latescibacteria bacterium]|nr:type I DNA topoisomerase [Candidatus Latescibacterota bacterium]NIM21348.1 type I DNA topoisomerase [Candidatus Latescibacterota bacterium]NIM65529.1 type I DNA topoisomerase [Candidatus Latescibacterota bacterium]NIO01909.1 type I DNA topoisomerase [Candidatus Latescibacterota bacterium]NIO28722.1 type I DNA topoisomerase [Candidatus Latescibacterota bacterium]